MAKRFFILIFSISMSVTGWCQYIQASGAKNDDTADQKYSPAVSCDAIFMAAEKEPEFPGGNTEWIRHIQRTLDGNIARKEGAPGGTYRVLVKFIVLKSGKIGDCEAITGFGYGMEKEVIRTIKKGGKWRPAQQNGFPVNIYKYQPVTFVVQPY